MQYSRWFPQLPQPTSECWHGRTAARCFPKVSRCLNYFSAIKVTMIILSLLLHALWVGLNILKYKIKIQEWIIHIYKKFILLAKFVLLTLFIKAQVCDKRFQLEINVLLSFDGLFFTFSSAFYEANSIFNKLSTKK